MRMKKGEDGLLEPVKDSGTADSDGEIKKAKPEDKNAAGQVDVLPALPANKTAKKVSEG